MDMEAQLYFWLKRVFDVFTNIFF